MGRRVLSGRQLSQRGVRVWVVHPRTRSLPFPGRSHSAPGLVTVLERTTHTQTPRSVTGETGCGTGSSTQRPRSAPGETVFEDTPRTHPCCRSSVHGAAHISSLSGIALSLR